MTAAACVDGHGSRHVACRRNDAAEARKPVSRIRPRAWQSGVGRDAGRGRAHSAGRSCSAASVGWRAGHGVAGAERAWATAGGSDGAVQGRHVSHRRCHRGAVQRARGIGRHVQRAAPSTHAAAVAGLARVGVCVVMFKAPQPPVTRSFPRCRLRVNCAERPARSSGSGQRGSILSPDAGVLQLVECQLPKLDVAGSSPVARSFHHNDCRSCLASHGPRLTPG